MDRLGTIKAYLIREFPESPIEDVVDSGRKAHTFRVHGKRALMVLKVSREFVQDNDKPQIHALLERWQVAKLLREHGKKSVLITSNGPAPLNH